MKLEPLPKQPDRTDQTIGQLKGILKINFRNVLQKLSSSSSHWNVQPSQIFIYSRKLFQLFLFHLVLFLKKQMLQEEKNGVYLMETLALYPLENEKASKTTRKNKKNNHLRTVVNR